MVKKFSRLILALKIYKRWSLWGCSCTDRNIWIYFHRFHTGQYLRPNKTTNFPGTLMTNLSCNNIWIDVTRETELGISHGIWLSMLFCAAGRLERRSSFGVNMQDGPGSKNLEMIRKLEGMEALSRIP